MATVTTHAAHVFPVESRPAMGKMTIAIRASTRIFHARVAPAPKWDSAGAERRRAARGCGARAGMRSCRAPNHAMASMMIAMARQTRMEAAHWTQGRSSMRGCRAPMQVRVSMRDWMRDDVAIDPMIDSSPNGAADFRIRSTAAWTMTFCLWVGRSTVRTKDACSNRMFGDRDERWMACLHLFEAHSRTIACR